MKELLKRYAIPVGLGLITTAVGVISTTVDFGMSLGPGCPSPAPDDDAIMGLRDARMRS